MPSDLPHYLSPLTPLGRAHIVELGVFVLSTHLTVLSVVVLSAPSSGHVPPCFYVVKVLQVNVFGG